MADTVCLDSIRRIVSPTDAFQVIDSIERHDFSMRPEHNCRAFFDAPDQISRHAVFETVGANEKMHTPCCLCKKQCGLAGRITTADDNDLVSAAQLCLDKRRPVVNSRAF